MYKIMMPNGIAIECNDSEEAVNLAQSLNRTTSVYAKSVTSKEDGFVYKAVDKTNKEYKAAYARKLYYAKKKSSAGGRARWRQEWTGKEIQTIAENINLPIKNLHKLLPGRTRSATANIRWELSANRLSKHRQKVYDSWLANK